MLFPEFPAACFFSIFPILMGLLAFDEEIKKTFTAWMMITKFFAYITSTIAIATFEQIGMKLDELDEMVINTANWFGENVLEFDVNIENWNIKNYQIKSLMAFLQLYTAMFFGSIAAATLVTGFFIVPFMY